LDEPVKESLKELGGEVKWIIAADAVHSMFTEEWSKAFPEAKCIGVEGLDAKRPNISWAGIYGKDREGTTYGFEEEIQARYFPTFANKDVAFHHIASRTAITADLLFNLPAKEQYLGSPSKSPSSPVPFLTGMSQKFNPFHGLHSTFLWNAGAGAAIPEACVPEGVKLSTPGGSTEERRARFAKDAEIFAGWGAERIIPCHGDVLEGNAREAWLSACKKVSVRRADDGSVRRLLLILTPSPTTLVLLSLCSTSAPKACLSLRRQLRRRAERVCIPRQCRVMSQDVFGKVKLCPLVSINVMHASQKQNLRPTRPESGGQSGVRTSR
jgi:hypothetical protein